MPSSALGFWRGVRRIEVLGLRLGPAMRSRRSVFHQRLNLLGRSNLFLGVVQPQELVNSDSPQIQLTDDQRVDVAVTQR